jgi:type II secretory pathway pseudopilin PulG
LVVVVIIVGLLAAIAIPRFTSAGDSATDSALAADLETLRKAIELYQGEHLGKFPDTARITEQLTQYTDVHGNPSPTKSGAYSYGPYLRTIPGLKVGPNRGRSKVAAASASDVGWVYDQTNGQITAAAGVNDRRGKPYGEY